MRIEPTAIPDVLLVEPDVHGDARGFFLESYNRRAFAAAGIDGGVPADAAAEKPAWPSWA